MKINIKSIWLFGILLSFVVLEFISFLLGVFTSLSYMEAFRIVFGSVFVLFLPGFVISFIFFPEIKAFDAKDDSKGIDWIERIALSFALSIAIVPLAVFYLNLVGVKINLLNSSIIVGGIIVIGLVIIEFRNWKN